jgi:hypothetical protein
MELGLLQLGFATAKRADQLVIGIRKKNAGER